MLKVEDIQKHLSIGRKQAYELVNKKGFPKIRIGRVIRIPEEAYHEWLERQVKAN